MDSEQLHRLLSDRQWLRRFSAAIQGRARACLRSGRVLRLAVVESLDDLAVLEAHVQGRRKTPYLARAVVEAGGRTVDLTMHCSCPMGGDCKHALAALMAASTQPPPLWPGRSGPIESSQTPPRLPEWERWLTEVERTSGSARQPTMAAGPDRRFVLLLRPGIGDPPEPLVAPVWVRPAKNKPDQWADPKGLQHGPHGPYPAPSGGCPPARPAR